MAKKSVANTKSVQRQHLSFDGGSRGRGGFGSWHPHPLSPEELEEARKDKVDGKYLDAPTARWSVGTTIGIKAAEEYIAYVRAEDSNFFNDNIHSELQNIALDMLAGKDRSDDFLQGQAIGFFGTLFPYFAFGVRTATIAANFKVLYEAIQESVDGE